MYLSLQNQLTLLHDLLQDQLIYKTVSIEEYVQIKKIVQAITTNEHIKGELQAVLPEIYYYGIKGERAQSLLAHVSEHETKIRSWLEIINRVKLHVSSDII